MSREAIQEGLSAVTLQYPIVTKAQPTNTLRFLQQAFLQLEHALQKEIQETTLTEMVQIANRMETFEQLFPQEIMILRMWLVGNGVQTEVSDDVYKQCTQAILRIMETMKTYENTPLTIEALDILQNLASEGSQLAKSMTVHQERTDRLKKFEQAIKNLYPEDREFIATLLKTKLESACRTRD